MNGSSEYDRGWFDGASAALRRQQITVDQLARVMGNAVFGAGHAPDCPTCQGQAAEVLARLGMLPEHPSLEPHGS